MMKNRKLWLVICLLAVGGGSAAALIVLRSEPAPPAANDESRQRLRAFWEAYNRATDLRSRGEFALASEVYEQALALDPRHEDSLYYLGNCLYELGEYRRAVKLYERLIELNPQSNRGHSQLGIALSTLAPGADLDFERARRAFARVAEINQEESGPFLRLGLLALHQDQPDEAYNYFLTAAGFKSPEGTFFAGYVKFRQGAYREAASYFQKVLEMNAREKQISGRGVFSEGDVKPASGQTLTPLEKAGVKALVFLSWTASKLGGYPRGVPAEFQINQRADSAQATVTEQRWMAGQSATADFDGDADLDLAVGTEKGMSLYRNHQRRLNLVTVLPPRRDTGSTPSVLVPVWGDCDGDGRPDLYVVASGVISGVENRLYRNEGNGRFAEITMGTGLAGKRATARARFMDYDGDGRMDLVEVGNAAQDQPPLRLFHNRQGAFNEVHQQAGIVFSGNAVDVAVGDYDSDGWLDLFVLRWKRPGLLYRNNGDGTFADVTEQAGLKGVGGDGFSTLFLDYNHDGQPDLFVTSQAPYEVALECLLRPDLRRTSGTPRLFRNRGNGQFEEVTSQVGLDRSYSTMQALAVDVDHDGWTDMVLANGGLEEYRLQPSVVLKNNEGKHFTEFFLPSVMNAHSVIAADFDGDGQAELLFSTGAMVRLKKRAQIN